MIIGVPKEIKDNEYRVAITPSGVTTLREAGHKVFIELNAGEGSGFLDSEYKNAGAVLIEKAELFKSSELIVKVKEPLPSEIKLLKKGQMLFTFLHLAAEKKLVDSLVEKEIVAIAYETIEDNNDSLPILTPMSEVAGKMSVQIGATLLQKNRGGRGILLGGIPGVKHGKVVVIGGGVVGLNAAKVAFALGAKVTVIDTDLQRLAYLDDIFGGKIETLMSNSSNIEEKVIDADILVGAVLLRGGKAPVLVCEKVVRKMKQGSVIVDVAVDQGGCVETAKPTSHGKPTYLLDGVIHYCVTNIPGIVPRTSTYALTNVTMPYVLKLANQGLAGAVNEDKGLGMGINIYKGQLTYEAVAKAFNYRYTPLNSLINFG